MTYPSARFKKTSSLQKLNLCFKFECYEFKAKRVRKSFMLKFFYRLSIMVQPRTGERLDLYAVMSRKIEQGSKFDEVRRSLKVYFRF